MPTPRYLPTDERRRTMRAMACYGVPHGEIARFVRCNPRSQRRVFRAGLDTAVTGAGARVAQCFCRQATTPGNAAVGIFRPEARAGWREKRPVGLGGPGGIPMPAPQIQVVVTTVTVGEVPSPQHRTEGAGE